MQQTNSLIRKNLVSGKSAQSNRRFLMTSPLGGAGSGEAPSWVSAPCSRSSTTNPLQQGLGSCCFFLKTFFFFSSPSKIAACTSLRDRFSAGSAPGSSPPLRHGEREGACVREASPKPTVFPSKPKPTTDPFLPSPTPLLLTSCSLKDWFCASITRIVLLMGSSPPSSSWATMAAVRGAAPPHSLPRRPPPQPPLIAALRPPPRRAPTSPPGAGLPSWPRPSRAQSHAHWRLAPRRSPEASVPGAGLPSWPRPPPPPRPLAASPSPCPGGRVPREGEEALGLIPGRYFLLNSPKMGPPRGSPSRQGNGGTHWGSRGLFHRTPQWKAVWKTQGFCYLPWKETKPNACFGVFFPLFSFSLLALAALRPTAAYGCLTSVVVGRAPPDGGSPCRRWSINCLPLQVGFFTSLSPPCSKKKRILV